MQGQVSFILQSILTLVLVVISCMIHEVAHGLVALAFGDTTARDAGRLSLNPMKHIDPFGSVLLPLLLALFQGPLFGYAKPVPYNPRNLKYRRVGAFCVGIMGPVSNLLQACIACALFRLVLEVTPLYLAFESLTPAVQQTIIDILMSYVMINISLACFNLLPIPPLDGSSVIELLLPKSWERKWAYISRNSMVLLMIILYILPNLIGFDIVGRYLHLAVRLVMSIMLGGLF